jgi:hypothetical protein
VGLARSCSLPAYTNLFGPFIGRGVRVRVWDTYHVGIQLVEAAIRGGVSSTVPRNGGENEHSC